MSAPGCFRIYQQKIHLSTLLDHANNQELWWPSGKLDGLFCHSGLSNFPTLRSSYPAGGQRIYNVSIEVLA
jgi:hypothetical protein